MDSAPAQRSALMALGREYHARGWSLGTSSNYSVVLDRAPLRLLITASGRDKGALTEHDFVVVDKLGQAADPRAPRPSAETLLHVVLARCAGAGAVLHTHSVWGTVLSRATPGATLRLTGYEMLKGLAGIATHETAYDLPLIDNTQDMTACAADLRARLESGAADLTHGFLLRGHGLYAWGRNFAEARRHVEVLEFLLECEGRSRTL